MGHLMFSYEGRSFTLLGIELWHTESGYGLYPASLGGLFEIDLNTYVEIDDFDLEELKVGGY